MKFHKYLEQVLGSKTAISIIRTMVKYRGKIFTVRSLAKEAKVSHNETALIIDDLEREGIVRIQPVGRAYQLCLNEKNYILKNILEPILNAEKNTFEELLQTLKKYLDTKKIISAALFGSITKREEKNESDIDLLLISNNFEYANSAASNAAEEVLEVFYGKISPIIFSEKEFLSKKNNNLIRSIIANHTMICGKDLIGIIK